VLQLRRASQTQFCCCIAAQPVMLCLARIAAFWRASSFASYHQHVVVVHSTLDAAPTSQAARSAACSRTSVFTISVRM
jgi:hypothetical protein